MEVPICKEDFSTMKKILFSLNKGWNDYNFYGWLKFWIDEITTFRYRNYRRSLVFWQYDKFSVFSSTNSPHKFFRYLFRYIESMDFLNNYRKYRDNRPTFKKIDKNNAKIKSGDSMIKLSLQIYLYNCEIKSIQTEKKWSWIEWGDADISRFESFLQVPARKNFLLCIHEIKNEVAYRPGNKGMMEAQDDYYIKMPRS